MLRRKLKAVLKHMLLLCIAGCFIGCGASDSRSKLTILTPTPTNTITPTPTPTTSPIPINTPTISPTPTNTPTPILTPTPTPTPVPTLYPIGKVEIWGDNFCKEEYVSAKISVDDIVEETVKIRWRGNSSTWMKKNHITSSLKTRLAYMKCVTERNGVC